MVCGERGKNETVAERSGGKICVYCILVLNASLVPVSHSFQSSALLRALVFHETAPFLFGWFPLSI